MKITAHACLESMMFIEALNKVKEAHKELADAHIELLNLRNERTAICYATAKENVDKADKEYWRLITAQSVIQDMEKKGVEI